MDPMVQAAASTLARDALWRDPPPLAADCDHDLELLPVIEPRFTVRCRKCGGLDVEASRAIGSTSPESPEYLILADSSVRKLKDPPGREWGLRHPGGKVTVRIDGHAFPSRAEAAAERDAAVRDCEWCDGGPHVLVCRDRQQWRETP